MSEKNEAHIMHQEYLSNTADALNRSIDRFLYADGWRVTNVVRHADDSGYDVTLTRTTEAGPGPSVTRTATSAGEATLKACSSARRLGETPTP